MRAFLLSIVLVPLTAAADSPYGAVGELIESHIAGDRIAGAVVAIGSSDGVLYHEAFGLADVEAGKPATTQTLYRIASMTKPITSVTALALIDEGKLGLGDPVADYIPAFADMTVVGRDGNEVPAKSPITVRQLLTHTSGLTYGSRDPQERLILERGICRGLSECDRTLAENIDRLATVPLIDQPGDQWEYGLSTDVLGRVIEVAAGQPFEKVMRSRVLDPLGMADTHFEIPEQDVDRLAALYKIEDGEMRLVGPGVQWEGSSPHSATYQLPGRNTYRSGGAGLVSTAQDYLTFCRMLLNSGTLDGVTVLKAETVAAMTSNQIGDRRIGFPIHGDKMGLGVGVHTQTSLDRNEASVGSYGWAGFFFTYFVIDPERDIAAVLMTQLHPSGGSKLWPDFQTTTLRAFDAARQDPARRPIKPRPKAAGKIRTTGA